MNLNIPLSNRQIEAAKKWKDNETLEILFGGAKGGGKSYLGASLIFSDALTYPGTFYFIARHTLKDLRAYTIPTINEFFENNNLKISDYVQYNGQDNIFKLYNNSEVHLIDCKYMPSDPDYARFGSMNFTSGWFEEIGEIPFEAFDNLRLSVGRKLNTKYKIPKKILCTCNPTPDWPFERYYKHHKNNTLGKDKVFIQSLVTDNIFRQKDYEKLLDSIEDDQRRARLRHGIWDFSDNENQIINSESISSMFTNTHVKKKNKKYMTCDVALEGSDLLVIGIWEGFVLSYIFSYEKMNGKEVEQEINKLKNKFKISNHNISYDNDGVGNYLKGYIPGAYNFINNGKTIIVKGVKENYQNLKTQCSYKMAQLINSDKIYISANVEVSVKDKIKQELKFIRKIHDDFKLKIEGKNEIKKKIGRSPDYSDMIIQRAIFELKSKQVFSGR